MTRCGAVLSGRVRFSSGLSLLLRREFFDSCRDTFKDGESFLEKFTQRKMRSSMASPALFATVTYPAHLTGGTGRFTGATYEGQLIVRTAKLLSLGCRLRIATWSAILAFASS
jgi:hypothetical protein